MKRKNDIEYVWEVKLLLAKTVYTYVYKIFSGELSI